MLSFTGNIKDKEQFNPRCNELFKLLKIFAFHHVKELCWESSTCIVALSDAVRASWQTCPYANTKPTRCQAEAAKAPGKQQSLLRCSSESCGTEGVRVTAMGQGFSGMDRDTGTHTHTRSLYYSTAAEPGYSWALLHTHRETTRYQPVWTEGVNNIVRVIYVMSPISLFLYILKGLFWRSTSPFHAVQTTEFY